MGKNRLNDIEQNQAFLANTQGKIVAVGISDYNYLIERARLAERYHHYLKEIENNARHKGMVLLLTGQALEGARDD